MPAGKQDPLLLDVAGHTACLLGNEAIVRGAVEAGVGFAAGYPGTPSSEITDSFARIAKEAGIAFEYAVNEKVALETAFGASLAGARSICAMKHVGLMYAGDPLSTIPYIGVVGGMVIVSAGDPSCRTSSNEQDQRLLAPMLHLPMLDPSTVQDAHAMAGAAFEISEQCQLPLVLRPTTRVCHTRGVIRYRSLTRPRVPGFVRDPGRFVPVPANARRLRLELTKRIETAERLLSRPEFFKVSGEGARLAIVASGAPAATCADVMRAADLIDRIRLVVTGVVYPLPERLLLESLQGVERVLVVEELSPYLEDALRSLCSRHSLRIEILGKRTGHFPLAFEYEPEQIQQAIHKGLGVGAPPREARKAPDVPPRPPTLCPGCPHRATQYAVRTVFGDEGLYFNDIGCYTLGYGPPLNTADALLSMGAAFTLAAGVSRVTGQRTVGLMGDSTFFHSGIPALLDAIKEDANLVAVILDNQVTAMTGFQESPGVTLSGEALGRKVSIEDLVRALGCRQVETVDPVDLPDTLAALEKAKRANGVSVIICLHPCPVFLARELHRPYQIATYRVDLDRCQTCGIGSSGHRCQAQPTERFQRHLARSRSLEPAECRQEKLAAASCRSSCPLGLCIQGMAGHIAARQYREAFELILGQIPLPESVCRVCHRPCEAACLRSNLDAPVAVNDLKRFVVEWARREGIPYEPSRDPSSGKKVAVVGAGPSGLAAAHDLVLRGHEVTLFDAASQPGGLLRSGIPPYRLPREALDRDVDRLLAMGMLFVGNQVLGRDYRLSDLLRRGFSAVYLAAGAPLGIRLGLDGEGQEGFPPVVEALQFLKQASTGAPVAAAKRVAVVGGGNAAIDAARVAKRLGAESVTIVYRRSFSDMPAIRAEVEAALQEGVALRVQTQPSRLDRRGMVCVATRPGEPDSTGRARPVPVDGPEEVVEADLVVAAVGQSPDPALLQNSDLELARLPDGSLQVNPETLETSVEKIFSGGDLVPGGRTVTEAIAAGRRAAWGIDRLLRGPALADKRPPPPRLSETTGDRPMIQRARQERECPPELPAAERSRGFGEVVGALTEVQACLEASRCLVCGLCGNCRSCIDLFGCPAFFLKDGRVQIDPELCMGCGVCVGICPNGAIRKVEGEPAPAARRPEPAFGPREAPGTEMEK